MEIVENSRNPMANEGLGYKYIYSLNIYISINLLTN